MKLYRFEKNEDKRLQTIINKSLWISRPQEFNDLSDCELDGIGGPSYDNDFYMRLKNCIETLYPSEQHNYFPLPDEILNSLRQFFDHSALPENSSEIPLISELTRNSIVAKVRNYLRKRTGVCCFFQGEPKHPLMWAHYANNHTGFCIEYEIEHTDNQLLEVNYTTVPVKPSIVELLLCPEETLLRILTRKSLEWNYEKEFRLIHPNKFYNDERGEIIPLPQTMNPIRLIKGANFDNEKNTELMKQFSIEVISYKSFKNMNSQ